MIFIYLIEFLTLSSLFYGSDLQPQAIFISPKCPDISFCHGSKLLPDTEVCYYSMYL